MFGLLFECQGFSNHFGSHAAQICNQLFFLFRPRSSSDPLHSRRCVARRRLCWANRVSETTESFQVRFGGSTFVDLPYGGTLGSLREVIRDQGPANTPDASSLLMFRTSIASALAGQVCTRRVCPTPAPDLHSSRLLQTRPGGHDRRCNVLSPSCFPKGLSIAATPLTELFGRFVCVFS